MTDRIPSSTSAMRSQSRVRAEEADVVALLRRGDADAISRILTLLGPLWHAVLHRTYGVDEHARDDIIQVALVKIWKNRDRYDPTEGSLKAWTMKIVRNTAIDRWRVESKAYRHAKRRIERRDAVEFLRWQKAVRAVLDELSPTQRQIMAAELDAYPDKADADRLAADLGIKSRQSVYSQRKKAYDRIEKLIGYRRPGEQT